MPYEFKIGQPGEVFFGTYGDYIVDFDLGEDSDTIEVVQMMVALVEDDDTGNDPFELMFGIRRRSLETGATTLPAFDHEAARQYVPKESADEVMRLVLDSIGKLMETVNPGLITMESFESDLPALAMAKYMRICNRLGELGYTLIECWRDGTDLKDYWFFTK
jgi:hypothetical protein